jgi:hypothetical protein
MPEWAGTKPGSPATTATRAELAKAGFRFFPDESGARALPISESIRMPIQLLRFQQVAEFAQSG